MVKFKYDILIPCFNSRKTIKRCIESALNIPNAKVIVWDDGSTDGSLEIIKSLSIDNPRIEYYISENYGVSHARNMLIKKSKSEFILFLDSDDFYSNTDHFGKIDSLINNGYDLVKFNRQVGKNGNYYEEDFCEIKNESADMIKINYPKLYDAGFVKNVTSVVFRRSIIIENNIKFDTSIRYAEDTCFSIHYLNFCTKCASVNICLYTYDKSDETSASNVFDYEMIKSVYDIFNLEITYFANGNNFQTIFFKKIKRLLNILSMKYKKDADIDFVLNEVNKFKFKFDFQPTLIMNRTIEEIILYLIYKYKNITLIKIVFKKARGY